MVKGKSLPDHTNLFSPNDYENYFQQLKKWKNYIVLFRVCIEFRKTKNIMHLRKNIISFYYYSKYKNEYEKLVKKEELIKILKIFGLIENT